MHIHRRYLDISAQWNIRMLDLKVGVPWSAHWIIRLLWNSPVTTTTTDQLLPLFVKKSTFRSICIVHPTGGGAAKLVCESCGAEYPYVANPSGCAFCSVMKESGIMVCVDHRLREWLWSDWGWVIKQNGYYLGTMTEHPIPPAIKPTIYHAKHKAYAAASKIKYADVEPRPIAPLQPAPDAIRESLMRTVRS
jgi:hypothetical protein